MKEVLGELTIKSEKFIDIPLKKLIDFIKKMNFEGELRIDLPNLTYLSGCGNSVSIRENSLADQRHYHIYQTFEIVPDMLFFPNATILLSIKVAYFKLFKLVCIHISSLSCGIS